MLTYYCSSRWYGQSLHKTYAKHFVVPLIMLTLASATLDDFLGGNEWCLRVHKADDKDCHSCMESVEILSKVTVHHNTP